MICKQGGKRLEVSRNAGLIGQDIRRDSLSNRAIIILLMGKDEK